MLAGALKRGDADAPSSANFDAAYTLAMGWGAQNSALEMLTMVPDFRVRMEGTTDLTVLMMLKKFVNIWECARSRLWDQHVS